MPFRKMLPACEKCISATEVLIPPKSLAGLADTQGADNPHRFRLIQTHGDTLVLDHGFLLVLHHCLYLILLNGNGLICANRFRHTARKIPAPDVAPSVNKTPV